jgi:uncharacterized protein (TIGR02246 family)
MSSEPESEIRAVFAELADTWNRGDSVAFGQLFDEDADFVTVIGSHSKGRQAITELHRFLFNGPLKGSRLGGTGGDMTIRFPLPDTAVVISRGAMQRPDGAAANDGGSINTTVLVRRGGRWSIAAFQNNRVQPIPGAR